MPSPLPPRSPRPRHAALRSCRGAGLIAGLALVAAVVGGCSATGAGDDPSPGSPSSGGSGSGSSSPSASTSPTETASAPNDSVTLTDLGFRYGPTALTLPAGTQLSTRSDQASTVTLVIARPSPTDVFGYLRTNLTDAGFRITGQVREGDTVAMTFSGHGWNGSFTGRDEVSGLTLMKTP